MVQALPSSHLAVSSLVLVQPPVLGSHASLVQLLPSSQLLGLPLHVVLPPAVWQVDLSVHLSPSSHAPPSGTALFSHCAVFLLQLSTVQGFLSSHCLAVAPPHLPAVHFSPTVHLSPSSQAPVSVV